MATKVKTQKKSVTPLMKQYADIKEKHPDAVLLFRVGDFYETFGEDAIRASKVLGIVLTKRHNGSAGEVELAGFPHHSLNTYLPKLVRSGLRVAICDQLEDPKQTKTIVKRGVTELVTPGVSYNDEVLDGKSNNFLGSLFIDKEQYGLALLDISTGEFLVSQGKKDYIEKLLQSFKPGELIYQKNRKKEMAQSLGQEFHTYGIDDWVYTTDYSRDILLNHFNTNTLKGFGIEELTQASIAAGAALHYLKETEHKLLDHISKVSRLDERDHVWLDKFTIRNLELLSSPHPEAKTLIDILDHTTTPMGSRLLKRWVAFPLKSIKEIENRHNSVDYLIRKDELKLELIEEIEKIGDLERLLSKVAVRRINPREVIRLKQSLEAIAPIKSQLIKVEDSGLLQMGKTLDLCEDIVNRISSELDEEPAISVGKGMVIKDGFNAELDELRTLKKSGKDHLLSMQQREIENTGISSLKIAYNNVFGYYIEVRNSHKNKVPDSWIRKQTLVNAERYITEELKDYEHKILGAEEKIHLLEQRLFDNLVESFMPYIQPIQQNAALIGRLDCFLSFAQTALSHNYTKPHVNEGKSLEIKLGRHPVIEQQLGHGEDYIANDVYLDDKSQQIMMITGPNMSGKSALLRQTALIVLMAQIGSFVPAAAAEIGIVDKIFTRVGASDNISSGESTFMVEMNETASILNNISDRSLILLDEIGRGTSTYDGISIAWAIAEYLHHSVEKPKTLFATHYHELNDMSEKFERIVNFNVSVREANNTVVFLRKLKAGGSEHSFGIHVAKMAGMPPKLLSNANQILKRLESSKKNYEEIPSAELKAGEMQLSFFRLDDPVLEQIRDELISININELTPVEALNKLNEIKKMVGGKE